MAGSEPDGISQELAFLEEENEEFTTTAQVVQKLQEAWLNETYSPELLPYYGDIVDCLLDQLSHMAENLRAVNRADFRSVLHRMELDRLQYVLTSYLKVRLEKASRNRALSTTRGESKRSQVEQQAFFLFGHLENSRDEEEVDFLSPEEAHYVRSYVTSIHEYLRSSALVHMPRNQQTLRLGALGRGPHLDRPVFLRAERNVVGLLVDAGSPDAGDGEIVDLDRGSQYLLMYRPVAPLVKDGSVVLV